MLYHFKTMKNKKALWIALIAVDVAVTIFLFTIHIIMLVEVLSKTPEQMRATGGFIGFLENNPNVYGWVFVLLTFLILAGNIVGLVFYIRKISKTKEVSVDDLSDEEKQKLLAQIAGEIKEKK